MTLLQEQNTTGLQQAKEEADTCVKKQQIGKVVQWCQEHSLRQSTTISISKDFEILCLVLFDFSGLSFQSVKSYYFFQDSRLSSTLNNCVNRHKLHAN